MAIAVDLIVDNYWITQDGMVADVRDAGGDANWLIRNAGWVRVHRFRNRLEVVLDGRCAGSRAIATALDVVRNVGARGPGAARFDIVTHDGDTLERVRFHDPVPACRHLMRCIERSDGIEEVTFRLFRQGAARVTTERLDPVALAGLPRLAHPYLDWCNGRGMRLSADIAGAVADSVTVLRIEDGEPRVESLGGGLLFAVRDAAGARLDDLMPQAHAEAARGRILEAAASGRPALRHHSSPLHDVIVLTLPVRDRGRNLCLSIARHHPDSPVWRPRLPSPGVAAERAAAPSPAAVAARPAIR